MTLVGAAVAAVFNASRKTTITNGYFIVSLYQTISEDVGVLVLASVVSTSSEWFRAIGESISNTNTIVD